MAKIKAEIKVDVINLEEAKNIIKQNCDLKELIRKIRFYGLDIETNNEIDKVLLSED